MQNLFVIQLTIKKYKDIVHTTILLQYLCGCKITLQALKKECRLRVFENGLQKRILWPRRDKVTVEW